MKYVNNFSELLNDSHKGQSGMACFQTSNDVTVTNKKYMRDWASEISESLQSEVDRLDADILADEDSIRDWMDDYIHDYLDSNLIYSSDIYDLMSEGYTGDQDLEDIFWQHGYVNFYDDLMDEIDFDPADYVRQEEEEEEEIDEDENFDDEE
jgi:hypothetical protein